VIVVVVSILIGQGLVNTIISQSKLQTAKAKASSQLDKNLVAAKSLVAEYKSLGDSKTLVEDALPSSADIPGFTVGLHNMASSVGMNIVSITPSETSPLALTTGTSTIQPIESVNVDATVEGSFNRLRDFLSNVEHSSRVVRVNSIQISGSGSSVQTSLRMTIYYQAKASIPFRLETMK